MIERLITIGLIVSTEYIQQIRDVWNVSYIKSVSAKRICTWCIEYFDEYKECPMRNIEAIYMEKLRMGDVSKEEAEDVEDILSGLSDEYEESFNLKYILDRTIKYFKERHVEEHSKRVRELTDAGDSLAAEQLISEYHSISLDISNELDLSSSRVLHKVEEAFMAAQSPQIKYPGALGQMWNNQLVRGAFVALQAPEKRGKSFWLLDLAIRATRLKRKVAFFQAGDMTELQQLKRICSYLVKKPDRDKYCGDVYVPIADCMRNQLDTCTKKQRECSFGVFHGTTLTEEDIRQKVTVEMLREVCDANTDYLPCRNCKDWAAKKLGVPWVQKVYMAEAVTVEEAKKKVKQFFIEGKKRLRLSTHANSTLSVDHIKTVLDRWERTQGFVCDVIVIDYADILITHKEHDFRHKQNQIWKDLRALSQERNALVITATQSDASSYDADLMHMRMFSEDKRKYGHVTAMYGLNQTKDGREKRIGLMRINELVVRDVDYDSMAPVTVLQNLNSGRPYIGSYL